MPTADRGLTAAELRWLAKLASRPGTPGQIGASPRFVTWAEQQGLLETAQYEHAGRIAIRCSITPAGRAALTGDARDE